MRTAGSTSLPAPETLDAHALSSSSHTIGRAGECGRPASACQCSSGSRSRPAAPGQRTGCEPPRPTLSSCGQLRAVALLSLPLPRLAVAPPTQPQSRPSPAPQPLRQQVPPPQLPRQESGKRIGEGPREIATNSALGIGQTKAEKERAAEKKQEEDEKKELQRQQLRQERSGETSALWFLNMGI